MWLLYKYMHTSNGLSEFRSDPHFCLSIKKQLCTIGFVLFAAECSLGINWSCAPHFNTFQFQLTEKRVNYSQLEAEREKKKVFICQIPLENTCRAYSQLFVQSIAITLAKPQLLLISRRKFFSFAFFVNFN